MRQRDFCFWLQGAFELYAPVGLGEAQVDCVRKHLDLVRESQKDVRRPNPHDGFIKSLRVILLDAMVLQGDRLSIVKQLLDAEFIHIDANTEGDQDAMDDIHNTGRPPGGNPRC
jgi:hypothetical protein